VRVKTARAIAVVVAGTRAEPVLVERRELVLYDPAVPHSGQPHHVELELPPARAEPLVTRAVAAVLELARRELQSLVSHVSASHELRGLGFVVGSTGDPERLGNPHVRAHAREGRLYWQALDDAARALGLATQVVVEREAYEKLAPVLARPPAALKRAVAELGRALGKPWGSDEKTAALAGWAALGASLQRNGALRRGARSS
jgi:hypothetical protein